MIKPLKLRAVDREDLEIISACLQDAIVPIADMVYLPVEGKFVMVANRFKWEASAEERMNGHGPAADHEDAPFKRTHCGLTFEGVRAVRRRGLNARDRSQLLGLLAIQAVDDGLMMTFAGGASIHLVAGPWTCWLQDIGDPWPCRSRPHHRLDEDERPALRAG